MFFLVEFSRPRDTARQLFLFKTLLVGLGNHPSEFSSKFITSLIFL